MSEIIIASPMRGWAAPLEEVPDPVFSERMLGDGVAIHPLAGSVQAPCDGEVATLHAAHHAVTIRTEEGAELLIHVGLDTVALAGDGFTARVAVGQKVKTGDPLIECDLDRVAQAAASLVSPIILANPDAFRIVRRTSGCSVSPGEMLMVLAAAEAGSDESAAAGPMHRRDVTIALPHGIHARPAARIAEAMRDFEAEIDIVHGGKRADARSPVGLLGLAVERGDTILIEARGADARIAADTLAALIEQGMGETDAEPLPGPKATPAAAADADGGLVGIQAAPGFAIGTAVRLNRLEPPAVAAGNSAADEFGMLRAAIAAARARIVQLAATAPPAVRSVLEAHSALLDDPGLIAAAERSIDAGAGAGAAWRGAIAEQVEILQATGNQRLRERVEDLRDLERQVLLALAGDSDFAPELAPGSILIARDLLPSQLAAIDSSRLAGLCLERGGPTSHVAILCAAMGVPALVALGEPLAAVEAGTLLALDADGGVLHIDPSPAVQARFARREEARRLVRSEALARRHEGCRTADGAAIEIFANLGSAEEARTAVANGAEGCGLLRTEFLFLDRDHAPDEAEQARTYQAVIDAMEGRPVIVRLLDVGGDKPVPYLSIPAEENPALGLRGIRVGLNWPELLAVQLRAILRVTPPGRCRIMLPMVASIAELRAVRSRLEAAAVELGVTELPQLGIMVETPAAAITADMLAAEADFLSIGSNDLAQYALAMDRGNASVAAGLDSLHPAVLRLIGETCQCAASRGKWTGLCGGLASDPAAIPILVGLGVTELSCVPGFVADAKAIVRRLSLDACRTHAARAANAVSAQEVRALAREFEKEDGR